ncbi:site-specific integrase, partial [Citricoccus sp.]|uniref:site-specific integrase n=1 Tax=Citricoccus sp. TaxID=1978372 RepID=UPI0028BE6734
MTSALKTHTTNTERHAGLILGWQSSHTSENTRRAYGRDLGQYLGWLDGIGLDPDTGDRVAGLDVLAVRRPVVDAYRLALVSGQLSPQDRPPTASTVARKLSAVSSFYAYAVGAGWLEA